MFDKAKKPITRGYADHKITTLQEGFAATNNLADLEEIKVPENCNVCPGLPDGKLDIAIRLALLFQEPNEI